MLTLHVEAPTHLELIQQTFKILGIGVGPTKTESAELVPPIPPADAPAPEPTSVATQEPATAISPETKRRGRPRKVTPAEGAPSGDGSATQAAVVENTAGAPAASLSLPAVEGASAAEDRTDKPAPSAADLLAPYEPIHEALNAMALRFKDQVNGGYKMVATIIAKHGFAKVKDMKAGVLASVSAQIIAEANAVKGDK